jgi:hypothetical protein
VIIGELRVCASIAPRNRTVLALPRVTVVKYRLIATRTLRLTEKQVLGWLGVALSLTTALRAMADIETRALLTIVVMLAGRVLQRPPANHVTGVFHVNALPR